MQCSSAAIYRDSSSSTTNRELWCWHPQELLQDWWNCPTDGTGHPSLFAEWPAEQGCLWRAVVNSTRWSAACVPDWETDFVGTRLAAWVHHLTSGAFDPEERDRAGQQAALTYFLHSMRQALVPKQARLGYSEHTLLPPAS